PSPTPQPSPLLSLAGRVALNPVRSPIPVARQHAPSEEMPVEAAQSTSVRVARLNTVWHTAHTQARSPLSSQPQWCLGLVTPDRERIPCQSSGQPLGRSIT